MPFDMDAAFAVTAALQGSLSARTIVPSVRTDSQPPDTTLASYHLSGSHLRMAVGDCIRAGRSLGETLTALWREDPERVVEAFDAATLCYALGGDNRDGRHGLLAERARTLRRPRAQSTRRGLPVSEIAKQAGINRETLCCLMEHHGYLELAPYGGRQRRRLVTQQAIDAGLGQNVDASQRRIAALEGHAKAAVFPVFYAEHVPSILWTLDYDRIARTVGTLRHKRDRLQWLLDHHDYLPEVESARLSGYSRTGWRRAGAALQQDHVDLDRPKVTTQVI